MKKPGPATRLLMKHRNEFLTQKMVQALLGHCRRDLAMLKKGIKPTRDKLTLPKQADYLYLDASFSRKMSDGVGHKNSTSGFYLGKNTLEGETTVFNLFQHPRGNMGPGSELFTPLLKKQIPDNASFLGEVYFDRGRFDRDKKTYRDRMEAPERSSAKATLAEIHGFETGRAHV